ncbi:MAG: type IV secretion system protein [Hydrogenophaga sp.]|uniref:type IV secretion system protein n=1 Tax=Hydrogenophaga sp. TaxID=1904254 RepID=UPI003D0A01B4
MIFYVLEGVDLALVTKVIKPGYGALSSFVAAPLRSGMVLLVAVHGFNLMKGHTQGLSAVDVGWLILKMGLVSELLINWGFFNTWVYGTIWSTYTGLADVLAKPLIAAGLSSPLGLGSSALDSAFMAQMKSAFLQMVSVPTDSVSIAFIDIPIPLLGEALKIPTGIPFPNLIQNIAGLIKFVMTIVLFASVFIVMLLSRLGLTSCLAVAPVFIALALFQHTRSYTDAWFRGMLGFALTPALLMLVLMVANASIAVFNAGPPAGWAPIPAAVGVIGPAIAYLILYYALAKSVASIPQFASGMVGSLLTHIGDGAAHQLIGGIHKGLDVGIGAAKGAAGGFVKGGPAGAKVGAAQGAAAAMGSATR